MSRKTEVLARLQQALNPLSGERIASDLSISRAAVWKAIEGLRKDGYLIEGVPNQGYRLSSVQPLLNQSKLFSLLPSYRIEGVDMIDSTNSELKRRNPRVKTLLFANTQSGGRGRLGRSFFSPRGGVYFSLALPLNVSIDSALLVTSIAAVATAEALSEIAHVETSIKWVNDLYLGDKKLCGILTEGIISMETKTLATVIIGIGINLHLPINQFPAELQAIATSAFDGGRPLSIDPNRLVQGIVTNIERLIEDLPDRSFLEIYRRRSNLIGKTVQVHEGVHSHPARVLGIDDDAHLLIADETGRTRSLSSGEVSIRLEG